MSRVRGIVLLPLILGVLACRTQPFVFDGGGGGSAISTDGMLDGGPRGLDGMPEVGVIEPDGAIYEARLLTDSTTNLDRVAVFKRSVARDVCAWLVLVVSPNSFPQFTTPAGWAPEHESINAYRDDCFTLDPAGPQFWGAEGSGSASFGQVVSQRPCAVNIHATLTSYLTVNGVARPADIEGQERFDADSLSVDGACGG